MFNQGNIYVLLPIFEIEVIDGEKDIIKTCEEEIEQDRLC